jgi:hypothetical protein
VASLSCGTARGLITAISVSRRWFKIRETRQLLTYSISKMGYIVLAFLNSIHVFYSMVLWVFRGGVYSTIVVVKKMQLTVLETSCLSQRYSGTQGL